MINAAAVALLEITSHSQIYVNAEKQEEDEEEFCFKHTCWHFTETKMKKRKGGQKHLTNVCKIFVEKRVSQQVNESMIFVEFKADFKAGYTSLKKMF